MASLEQKLKEMDEECRVEERRRVDLELSIVEVKDSLKKAEAGPVTLGTTVDTTHLENVSPRVSPGAPSSWTKRGDEPCLLPPLTQPSLSSDTTAQSGHPDSCPRLYPGQLRNRAQEQASVGHGHGQRHRPPESQGKQSLLCAFRAPRRTGLSPRLGWGTLLTRAALPSSECRLCGERWGAGTRLCLWP